MRPHPGQASRRPGPSSSPSRPRLQLTSVVPHADIGGRIDGPLILPSPLCFLSGEPISSVGKPPEPTCGERTSTVISRLELRVGIRQRHSMSTRRRRHLQHRRAHRGTARVDIEPSVIPSELSLSPSTRPHAQESTSRALHGHQPLCLRARSGSELGLAACRLTYVSGA